VALHPQARAAAELAGDLPVGLPLSELRRRYTEQRLRLVGPAPAVAVRESFDIPGRDGPIAVRFYRAVADAASRPLLVFFHGGGWMLGSLDGYDATCRRLATKGECSVVSVDYRLAPESPFPAAVHDALDATRWCAIHAARLGADPRRLAVGGDSAGGNLAAVVAQQLRGDPEVELALQVLIYPVTDVSRECASYVRNATGYMLTAAAMRTFIQAYVPNPADRVDVRASPLLAEDLSGLPRALVIAAEHDPLVDENEAYARRLAAAGVPTHYRCFDGMLHPFFTLGGVIEAAGEAEDMIAAALRTLR
jgi:acetyl esterase